MQKLELFLKKEELLPNEEWRDIPGYPLYRASNQGRIMRKCHEYDYYLKTRNDRDVLYPEKIIKLRLNRDGYYIVNIYNDKHIKKTVTVHRLIALAWIPNDDPEKTQVNHVSENKKDNRLDNLEWTTPKQNANHGTRNDRVAQQLTGRKLGHYSKKRRANISKGVIASGVGCKPVIGKDGLNFKSAKACAKYFKISSDSMRAYLRGAKRMPERLKKYELAYEGAK